MVVAVVEEDKLSASELIGQQGRRAVPAPRHVRRRDAGIVVRAVPHFAVVDAEDGRAVEAAVGLAGGFDLFVGGEFGERVVHAAHGVVVAVEEGLEELERLGRMRVEFFAVGAMRAEAGADIDASGSAVADLVWVVEQAAFVEPPHEPTAVCGLVVLAQYEGGHLAVG